MHCQAGPEAIGPASPPDIAFETKAEANKFVYRICRRGESPWTLRQVSDVAALSFKEQRVLMAMALGMGNSAGHTSPFLHTSSSLSSCLKVFRERHALYSNRLVRWLITIPGVECVNFGVKSASTVRWLTMEVDDSKFIEECIRLARFYTEKD